LKPTGCGIFGGDKAFKFLQQLCAASVAKVDLDYSCFKDNTSFAQLQALFKLVQKSNPSVAQLCIWMTEFERDEPFVDYISKKLK
jgi:hypothetical protein